MVGMVFLNYDPSSQRQYDNRPEAELSTQIDFAICVRCIVMTEMYIFLARLSVHVPIYLLFCV